MVSGQRVNGYRMTVTAFPGPPMSMVEGTILLIAL
jgi:hypothetical protein